MRRVDLVPAAPSPALEVTILMPCLNEARTLAACIDKAHGFLRRTGVAGEVLIADNGSTDGSQDIARRHDARVIDVGCAVVECPITFHPRVGVSKGGNTNDLRALQVGCSSPPIWPRQ